jgi:hypothetical protein
MSYNATLSGQIKWSCDKCHKKITTNQKSYGVNMKSDKMNFNVQPPSGWSSYIDEYGTAYICEKCK